MVPPSHGRDTCTFTTHRAMVVGLLPVATSIPHRSVTRSQTKLKLNTSRSCDHCCKQQPETKSCNYNQTAAGLEPLTTNSEVGVSLPIRRLYHELSLNPKERDNFENKNQRARLPNCRQKLKIAVMNVRTIRLPNKR